MNLNTRRCSDILESMENEKISSSIGIVGGMGPRATVLFEDKLVNSFTVTDQLFPPIFVVNDGAVPDRTNYLVAEGANPAPKIQEAIDKLLSQGSKRLCMPCNTAHSPQILSQLDFGDATFVNMIEEVSRKIAEKKIPRILLLATRGTVKTGVYSNYLEKNGINLIVPDEQVQNYVDNLIKALKAGDRQQALNSLEGVLEFMSKSNTKAAILGCTELSLIASDIPKEYIIIDSLDILAEVLAN